MSDRSANQNLHLRPVRSARKQATGDKRGKNGNRCEAQARENLGKLATGAKRGKTGDRCEARENWRPVLNAKTLATSLRIKRGKTRVS